MFIGARGSLAILVCCLTACFQVVVAKHQAPMRKRRVLQEPVLINNKCTDATSITAPYFTEQSTAGIVPDDTHRSDVFRCGSADGSLTAQHFDNDIPRLYFRTVGTGGFLIARLCSKVPAAPHFLADTFFRQLYLFKGECGVIGDSLECLDVSDAENGLAGCPGFVWQSEAGQTYFLAAESNGESGAPIYLDFSVNNKNSLAAEVALPFFSGTAATKDSRDQFWYIVYGTGATIVAYVCDMRGDGIDRVLSVWIGDSRETPTGMPRITSTSQVIPGAPGSRCEGYEWKSALGQAYSLQVSASLSATEGDGTPINLFVGEDTESTEPPTERPTESTKPPIESTDPPPDPWAPVLGPTDPPTPPKSSASAWATNVGLVWFVFLTVSIGVH